MNLSTQLVKNLLLIVGVLILAGCANSKVWEKPGSSRDELLRDSYECEKDARQTSFGSNIFAAKKLRQEFYDRCMTARGWEKE